LAATRASDLVVVAGDPSVSIGDIRKVEMVFRQGVAYDPAKLITSVAGRVGLF
jgi:imidazolonepropionase-like amidohydrolase